MALDIEGWTTVRDKITQAAYSYKGDQWVSYDDATTATAKVIFSLKLIRARRRYKLMVNEICRRST